jgi:predicted DNA-binding protein (UPF0251 family)
MPGVFGGFYRALYKGLSDPEFDWVRHAFEDFIAENWSGAMGRRNRRMPPAVLARLAWLPAAEAAAQLGISGRRLAYLIEAGRVTASRRLTVMGREFVMVRRADIQVLVTETANELTLVEAATRLGIKRQRLSRLLPMLCPNATKVTLQGTPWLIPRSWVDGWLQRLDGLSVVDAVPADVVSVDHLLRYGPLDDRGVAGLLLDIAEERRTPVGRTLSCQGLRGILLDRRWVREIHGRSASLNFAVPEAAERLEVKPQVAYALIKAGLLVAEQGWCGRRRTAVISELSLQRFNEAYVLASSLAASRGQSPKAVVQALRADGIEPVAGPSLGNCRQVVYSRKDLTSASWLQPC